VIEGFSNNSDLCSSGILQLYYSIGLLLPMGYFVLSQKSQHQGNITVTWYISTTLVGCVHISHMLCGTLTYYLKVT